MKGMAILVRKLIALVVLASALVVSACGGSSAAVTTVDASAFLQVAQQPGITVIDVRTPAEYAAGHLDGAINVDAESPDFDSRIASLGKSASYAVYCQSGRRSAIAADRMSGAGFTSITNLKGGIADLQAAGGRIVMS